MKKEHLKHLVCPICNQDLIIFEINKYEGSNIENGLLKCSKCFKQYSIIHSIPRFVSMENYASGFGLQWTKHARTQYDSYTGLNISETRFFNETKWARILKGQIILEVGGGSGRFTEQAMSTGAFVVSVDYSYAVDANYNSNGTKDNVLIVQADIYNMPFRNQYFDKIFCIGVLQHTPNVELSFLTLHKYLKSGGNLVIDIYRKSGSITDILNTKYWIRPFTKRMNPEKLYKWCQKYIEIMWILTRLLNKIPYWGRLLNKMLLIADYRGLYLLSEDLLKEWAVLDTFDMLSPKYDSPQNIETVKRWFKKAKMINVDIH